MKQPWLFREWRRLRQLPHHLLRSWARREREV